MHRLRQYMKDFHNISDQALCYLEKKTCFILYLKADA